MKSFGAHAALAGLTMTVPAGAVYGLVGPNGAGKTTAIRHITGVLRADSGDVLADGEPIYEKRRRQEPHGLHPRRGGFTSPRPR